MKIDIDIKRVEVEYITPQEEPIQGKRWSFSYVYFLEDLRNVYRLYDNYVISTISVLYQKCKELDIKSWNGKAWTQRNLLEIVNALKNFQLLSVDDNRVVKSGLFSKTQPEEPLSVEEKQIFKDIYFGYFRFLEFHKLFFYEGSSLINKTIEDSVPIFYYMQDSRFTNRFILRTEPDLKIVGLSAEHSDMMRFWDVYIKWGTSLNLLKKYPLKPFGINTVSSTKGLSIAYFYNDIPKDFSVFDYILKEMQGAYFYIPDILYSIMINKRYSIEDIIERIKDESTTKSDVFRAQSTSAIFIDEKEGFLFPKIGNTFVTHLLKL